MLSAAWMRTYEFKDLSRCDQLFGTGKPELLQKGFELVNRGGLEVTDDVSIVEHLKHPVYITEGSYTNIKVTTPDDLLLAERILNTASALAA
ncbi:hypothetical protein LguiB_006858 [Lonicera macranthoides]